MVRFVFSSAASLAAVRVRTLLPEAGFGEKAAVTPLGRPEMANWTLPTVEPDEPSTYMLAVVVLPGANPMDGGADRSRLPSEMVSVRGAEAVLDPQVPLIVTVLFPGAAVLLAVSVSVAALVVGSGEKDAVTPVGRPLAESLTLPVNPNSGLTKIAVEVTPPGAMTASPQGWSVKVGVTTFNGMVVIAFCVPDVPVTVTVHDPAFAALLAFRVKMVDCVMRPGSKLAVTPVGNPETAR
jgi:hypothetical protein